MLDDKKMAEVEYDKAFAEVALSEDGTLKEEPKEEKEEPAAPEKDTDEPKEGEPEDKQDDGEPKETEETKSPPATEDKSDTKKGIEKALHDTKAWATQLSQQNAEYRAKLAEYEKGLASKQDVADAKKAVSDSQDALTEELEKVYEDYPEFKNVLGPIAEMVKQSTERVAKIQSSMDEERRIADMRLKFERDIEPEVVKVHPEFSSIKTSEAYFKWAEQQSPAMRNAAMFSLDPRDLIMAVGEYKKHLAAPEAQKQKADDDGRKQSLRSGLASMPGKNSTPSPKKEPSNDDYEGAFEEAASKFAK